MMQTYPFTEKEGEYGLSVFRITHRPGNAWQDVIDHLDMGIREADANRRAMRAVMAMQPPVQTGDVEYLQPSRLMGDSHDNYQKIEIYRTARLGVEYLMAMGQAGPERAILTNRHTIENSIKDCFSYALALGIVLQDCINAIYATRQMNVMVDVMGQVDSISRAAEDELGDDILREDRYTKQDADSERQETALDLWLHMERKALYFLSYVPYALDFDLALPLLNNAIEMLSEGEEEQLRNFTLIVEAQRERPKAPSPS